MKKQLLTLLICLIAGMAHADSLFIESFEYANHDMTIPIGWNCEDESWLCGYLEKDHNRKPHTGNWYAFSDADDAWMFMPMFLNTALKYRFSCWSVADGTYELEFWAGNQPEGNLMEQQLCSFTVSSGDYEYFSYYVEQLNANYEYLGIRAVAAEGAYHLTIDDILVDMVEKYDMEVTPYTFEATMMPGTQITVSYQVQNTGYEPLHIYMTPYTDYFSNISFTENGFPYSSFPTEPNEIVDATCTATLNPDIPVGTRVWLDIMFTVSCDCVTRMATIWVDVVDGTGVPEEPAHVEIYPNPVTDLLTVKAEGLQQVELKDVTGRTLAKLAADQDEVRVDMSAYPRGIYFATISTSSGKRTERIIK